MINPMRAVSLTLIETIQAPIDQVFSLLTDPGRIARWLPGCEAVEGTGPVRKGVRLKARFGQRQTEFEIVDCAPPNTFGWIERGQRKGAKLFFRLDSTGGATAVTVRDVWTPPSFFAWVRGRFFEKRHVKQRLNTILRNVRNLLAG